MKPIKLIVKTKSNSYPVIIGSGLINNLPKFLSNNLANYNNCLLVIDKKIPKKTVNIITKIFKKKIIKYFFNASEKNKNQKSVNAILNILLKKNFSILILDSYKDNFILEKTLVKKGIFVISLDDHLKKHFSNIVVTNRSGEININNKTSNQIWLTGSKYILVTKNYKKKNLKIDLKN